MPQQSESLVTAEDIIQRTARFFESYRQVSDAFMASLDNRELDYTERLVEGEIKLGLRLPYNTFINFSYKDGSSRRMTLYESPIPDNKLMYTFDNSRPLRVTSIGAYVGSIMHDRDARPLTVTSSIPGYIGSDFGFDLSELNQINLVPAIGYPK